ncbi:ABC transporter permease [Leucobacter sp. M11]|nr:ABC transporter permease [Leucobacter sp. M11]
MARGRALGLLGDAVIGEAQGDVRVVGDGSHARGVGDGTIDTLPVWLQTWANINPVTHAMDAARGLLSGFPLGDSVTLTLLWSAVIFLVFCPLSVWAFARKR